MRRLAPLLLGFCAIVTVVLGIRFSGDTDPGPFDRLVDATVEHQVASKRELLDAVVPLGSPLVVTGSSLGLAIVSLMSHRRRMALFAVLGPAVASIGAELIIKPLVGRTLGGNLAFPSGHTTGIVAVITATAILVANLGVTWPVSLRAVLAILFMLLPTALAVAMVGLGCHYATDTVGGFTVGTGAVIAVALGLDMRVGG